MPFDDMMTLLMGGGRVSDVYLLMFLGALADFASYRASASFWRDFTLNLDLSVVRYLKSE